MNKKDLKIIAYLRQNARMPLTKMSRKTQIPVSTIFDRLKMNENSLIVKHTSLLDFSKLGYNTRANITLKVDR
ncbi:winged helix-turn-helix transcriptional regulator, partial [Candidatus Woesearchaeota archaeon]|nr:winged helix-turn-helix transcriptional regulator [Candidatus Woesearchaeota archaeon]